jgi:hypothetical protein
MKTFNRTSLISNQKYILQEGVGEKYILGMTAVSVVVALFSYTVVFGDVGLINASAHTQKHNDATGDDVVLRAYNNPTIAIVDYY